MLTYHKIDVLQLFKNNTKVQNHLYKGVQFSEQLLDNMNSLNLFFKNVSWGGVALPQM